MLMFMQLTGMVATLQIMFRGRNAIPSRLCSCNWQICWLHFK